MLAIFDSIRDLTFFTVLLRACLAFLFGGMIGFERSFKNRPAGFRTHILVCVAAAIASMTGIYLYTKLGLPTDISRAGAAVISGLGFIGAGTIIVTRDQAVKGLTTAAGLWTAGIIGLAVGAGFYEGAAIASALVLATETFVGTLAHKLKRDPEFSVELQYSRKDALDEAMRCCKDCRHTITNLQVTRVSGEASVYVAVLTLRPRGRSNRAALIGDIEKIAGIDRIREA